LSQRRCDVANCVEVVITGAAVTTELSSFVSKEEIKLG